MPSWHGHGAIRSKTTATTTTKMNMKHSSAPVIHFVDFSRRRDSDGESQSSSLTGDGLPPNCGSLTVHFEDGVKEGLPYGAGCSQLLQDVAESHTEELRYLDHLGVALESTFKEVESIDAYVSRLRDEFDHELVSEKRFMSCICSARLARAACCKKQIEAWRLLQHGILELCCHHHHHHREEQQLCENCTAFHHHHHHHHHDSDGDVSSCGSHQDEVESVVGQLSKLPSFRLVQRRLDPKADSRYFVEHWIINSPLLEASQDVPQSHMGDTNHQQHMEDTEHHRKEDVDHHGKEYTVHHGKEDVGHHGKEDVGHHGKEDVGHHGKEDVGHHGKEYMVHHGKEDVGHHGKEYMVHHGKEDVGHHGKEDVGHHGKEDVGHHGKEDVGHHGKEDVGHHGKEDVGHHSKEDVGHHGKEAVGHHSKEDMGHRTEDMMHHSKEYTVHHRKEDMEHHLQDERRVTVLESTRL